MSLLTLQEKKSRVLEKFREGCTWQEAATAVNTSRMSIWRWSQADPDFAQAIKDACAGPDEEVEAVTYGNATDPDPAHNTLRIFWLKSRLSHRYRESFDHNLSGEIKVRVEYADEDFDDPASEASPRPGDDSPEHPEI